MILGANRKQKRTGMAIIMSDKIDFKSKSMTKEKNGHYKMIKQSVHQEDVTIVNVYVPSITAPKYTKCTKYTNINSSEGDNRQQF